MSKLLTPEQAVAEFNLPSVRTIRTLRNQGLPTVKLGAARLIDYDDMVNFIERRKQCQGETQAQGFVGSTAGRASTSSGMSKAANDSGLLARQTANALKQSSRRSSAPASAQPAGRVLPMRSR
jgi:hypothetical protein